MTNNDIPSTPSPGQWVLVDPQNSAAILANPQMIPQYAQVAQMRTAETPATTGIVLDQKVFVALILVLGVIAGIVLMLVLDKYHKPAQG
jgi:hypothetical protein